MKPGQTITVTVDAEAQARADEVLDRALEAELQAALKGNTRMDAAQQADFEAAKKDAEAARADAAAAKKDAADLLKAMVGLAEQLKARGDAEKAAADAEILRRANIIATLGDGLRGDAAVARSKELAALGRVAVDHILARTPAPAGDATILAMHGAGPDAKPAGDETVKRGFDEADGKPTWTVTQAGWEKALGRKLTRHQGGRTA